MGVGVCASRAVRGGGASSYRVLPITSALGALEGCAAGDVILSGWWWYVRWQYRLAPSYSDSTSELMADSAIEPAPGARWVTSGPNTAGPGPGARARARARVPADPASSRAQPRL